MRLSRPIALVYVAGFLRSMGVGLLGVVLGVYLSRIGFSATRIGFVLAAGLAGISVSTALMSVWADRLGRRRTMLFLTLLSGLGGVALATLHSLAGLLPIAFISMLNGMGTDRSAIFALEQAILPGLVRDDQRTWALAWYNVLLDSGGAVGSLAAGLPVALEKWAGLELLHAYRYVFIGYAVLNVVVFFLYSLLPEHIEVATRGVPAQAVSLDTKKTVHRMAALFGLDSLGGGFLGDALVAYWFFRRFGLVEQTLGVLFFVVRILNALSHLGAAWLSRKIGLVNTMVFTHLPSSLFLICVPLMKSPLGAIAFFLARESLVEMDVPTRQSYVAAVVQPHERTYASGVTNLTRTVAWAVSSSMAGAVMQYLAFSAPLVLGGSMKIAYDVLLFRGFRKLKPPEEAG